MTTQPTPFTQPIAQSEFSENPALRKTFRLAIWIGAMTGARFAKHMATSVKPQDMAGLLGFAEGYAKEAFAAAEEVFCGHNFCTAHRTLFLDVAMKAFRLTINVPKSPISLARH